MIINIGRCAMFSLMRRLLDTTDPTASLRHAAYALVIVMACGWLSFALYRSGIDGNWVAAFGLLLAAVTTGKVMGSNVGAAVPPARVSSDCVELSPSAGAKIGVVYPDRRT